MRTRTAQPRPTKAPASSIAKQPDSLTADAAARAFSAIGSETRLDVLRVLVRAGPPGLSVGEIQERLGTAASTLTHHLKFLAAAELIQSHKSGRVITNVANFDRLGALARFLLSECCSDAHCNARHSDHADDDGGDRTSAPPMSLRAKRKAAKPTGNTSGARS